MIKSSCLHLLLSSPCHLVAANEITENNVMEFIAAIEKKALDFISAVRDFDDSEAESQTMITDPVKKSTEACVSLPNMDDFAENDIEDEEDRPLTVVELQSSLKCHEVKGRVESN